MSLSRRHRRARIVAGALALVVFTSGCSWVKSKFNAEVPYKDSQLAKPLEAPPGLDLPRNSGSFVIPDAAGVSGGEVAAAPPAAGLAGEAVAAATADVMIAGGVDAAWKTLGDVLKQVEGVAVASQSQLLHSYEINYDGHSLLLSVEARGEQSRVLAVGADGQPLAGGAAAKLMRALQAKLD